MIFGKTYEEEKKEEEDRFSKFPFIKRFAIFPTRLHSGRWVWLDFYYIMVHRECYGSWRISEYGHYDTKYIDENFRNME